MADGQVTQIPRLTKHEENKSYTKSKRLLTTYVYVILLHELPLVKNGWLSQTTWPSTLSVDRHTFC